MSQPSTAGPELLAALGIDGRDITGDLTIDYHGASVIVRWTSAAVIRTEALQVALESTRERTPTENGDPS